MNILIVEDAPNIRNNLKKFIAEIKNCNVSGEAEDSAPAIKLIKETKPDVIILDVELKNSSGFEVLKYVKGNECPSDPVVIMFSNHIKYKEKAQEAKANYFFDKTEEVDELLSTINELKNL